VLFKGLETLTLRMEAHAKSAFKIASWLENHDKVSRVFYPWLASHPQHELARKQQTGGGGIVSFDVGDRKRAWGLIDNVKLISITANLGDTRSTITHPASTTHGRVPESDRLAAGITEGLIRVAVGLEGVADLQSDLEDALVRI
jgi:O-succinylhomoserine sulfhydrylase